MAKRKILNRRSSRSSRYTGSGILDPDTDVIDNEYPCWWKDLENNTMVRPSINYSMLNETSQHLNSSSRIEVSKADDGWWKALDATNSSSESDNRIQRGAPKVRIASSESEEEQQVKKRKLPLRSKAKVPQKNAFFNVLNDSEDSTKKITTPDNRNQNLISNSDSNSKIVTNEEQLTNTRDSRSNQSSNLNNILKSKPKIFKKNYKNQRRSIFVDALQDNEFKAPQQRRSSIMDSPIVARKNSNNMIGLENQSESTEFTSFLNSMNDLSNLPAPKAQSTTLEDSTPHNSTKNSISDVEYKIVKRKPKLLRRPTKSIKRNVSENTSVAKETDKGTEIGNLTNVVENIEKSKSLKRRTRSTKRNVFEDIFAAEESSTQTETSKLSNAESVEIAKQPLIISLNDLSKSPRKLQKNDVNEDENNDTEKIRTPRSRKKRKSATLGVEKSKESIKDRLSRENVMSKDNSGDLLTQSHYNLRKSTNMDAGSESLKSPGSTMKGKNTRQRSTWNQNDINDKNDENMLNETGVSESASKGSNDEQVSNELENVNENQENIPRSRSAVNVVSSFNRKERVSTVNRSRSLSKTSKLGSLVEKERNRMTSSIIDKDAGEAEEKDSYVARNEANTFRERSTNVSSGSNKNKRNETGNRGRSSHRASNITLPVESIANVRTDTLNISSKNIREDESISNESSDEEIFHRKSQNADVFQKRSVSNDLRASKTMKNSNRLSSRNSNLMSSLKKIDTDRNASESEDENLNHSDEETQHQSRYVDKRTSTRDRKSANVSSRNRLSSRTSKLASFTRKSDGIDTDTLKIDDKTARDARNDDTSDSNNEELTGKVTRSSRSKSGANVSFSFNEKERNDTGNHPVRVSSRIRANNLASSQTIRDTHANVDDNTREAQDEDTSDSEEEPAIRVPRLSQKSDRAERDATDKLSFKDNNLKSATKKRIRNISTNATKVDDKNINDVEDKVPSESNNEELTGKVTRSSRSKSGANVSFSFNEEERNDTGNHPIRVSSRIRASNLASSQTIRDTHANVEENAREAQDEDTSDSEEEPAIRVPRLSQKSDRAERDATDKLSFKDNNLKSATKKRIRNISTNATKVDDKNINDVEDKVPSESNNEELTSKVTRSSRSKSAANVSFSFNEKERNDAGKGVRVSSRIKASNLASSQTIEDTHANVDDNAREVQDEDTSDSDEEPAIRVPRLSQKSDRAERDDTETRDKLSFKANNLMSVTKKRLENTITNASKVNDWNLKDVEDKVPSESSDEEVVFNASRSSRRKFNVNSSSDSDEQERERTENVVSPRTSNLVSPVKEITRNNKKVSSVVDKDGRETMEEESIRIGNEASPELHLRYSDKEQNDVSRTPVTSMSHNDNRRKRSAAKSGRSLFRTSNRTPPVKSIENTDTRSSNANDNEERETQNEEPVANVQRSSRRSAIDVSSSFNRKERSNTENRSRTSSKKSNLASMDKVGEVNSSDTNVDGKNVTETEDEAANNLETVYKKPKNVSLKKCFVNLSSEIGRKTGSDVGTGGKSSRTRNSRTSMTKTAKEKKNASNVNDTAKETEDNGNEEAPDRSQRVRKHKSLLDQIIEATRKARGQRSIRPYFNVKEALKMTPANEKKMEKARETVEKVKQQEMNIMNLQRKTQPTGKENMKERKKMVPRSKSKPVVPKAVHKAYLVNGQVYKVPRLPRPKVWVTDRLYNHLWKTMEPKYKLETRVISEKFVCRLSSVTASIAKQKSYQNYRGELYALMKEMARLGIVRTRNDFYNFCHDFFPYELRAKMVPMLLPGNKRNIPYDPSTLHTPILDS